MSFTLGKLPGLASAMVLARLFLISDAARPALSSLGQAFALGPAFSIDLSIGSLQLQVLCASAARLVIKFGEACCMEGPAREAGSQKSGLADWQPTLPLAGDSWTALSCSMLRPKELRDIGLSLRSDWAFMMHLTF